MGDLHVVVMIDLDTMTVMVGTEVVGEIMEGIEVEGIEEVLAREGDGEMIAGARLRGERPVRSEREMIVEVRWVRETEARREPRAQKEREMTVEAHLVREIVDEKP